MVNNNIAFRELFFADSLMSPIYTNKFSHPFKWISVILNRFIHLLTQWSLVTDYRLSKHVVTHITTPTNLSDFAIIAIAKRLRENNPHNQELSGAIASLEARMNASAPIPALSAQMQELHNTASSLSTFLATQDGFLHSLQSEITVAQNELNRIQNEIQLQQHQLNLIPRT